MSHKKCLKQSRGHRFKRRGSPWVQWLVRGQKLESGNDRWGTHGIGRAYQLSPRSGVSSTDQNSRVVEVRRSLLRAPELGLTNQGKQVKTRPRSGLSGRQTRRVTGHVTQRTRTRARLHCVVKTNWHRGTGWDQSAARYKSTHQKDDELMDGYREIIQQRSTAERNSVRTFNRIWDQLEVTLTCADNGMSITPRSIIYPNHNLNLPRQSALLKNSYCECSILHRSGEHKVSAIGSRERVARRAAYAALGVRRCRRALGGMDLKFTSPLARTAGLSGVDPIVKEKHAPRCLHETSRGTIQNEVRRLPQGQVALTLSF